MLYLIYHIWSHMLTYMCYVDLKLQIYTGDFPMARASSPRERIWQWDHTSRTSKLSNQMAARVWHLIALRPCAICLYTSHSKVINAHYSWPIICTGGTPLTIPCHGLIKSRIPTAPLVSTGLFVLLGFFFPKAPLKFLCVKAACACE